jgi:hypothetical protein
MYTRFWLENLQRRLGSTCEGNITIDSEGKGFEALDWVQVAHFYFH